MHDDDVREALAAKLTEAARWRRYFAKDSRSTRNADCISALERAAVYVVEGLDEEDPRLRTLDTLGLDSEAIESRIARYGFAEPPDHEAFLDALVEAATKDEASRGVDRFARELANHDD